MTDDAERVDMISEGARTARKQHKCKECGRLIEPGERYAFDAYVFDGEFQMHKVCAHCQVAREWLQLECGGWIYGAVVEDIGEHCAEGGYPMPLYRMAVGMKWKWRTPSGRLLPVPALPPLTLEVSPYFVPRIPGGRLGASAIDEATR